MLLDEGCLLHARVLNSDPVPSQRARADLDRQQRDAAQSRRLEELFERQRDIVGGQRIARRTS